jgi:hypothetical protein
MTGALVTFAASFAGSATGIGLGSVLAWRYYLKPKMARAGRAARVAAAATARPAPSSQAGFVRHEGDVTVGRANYGRVKRAVRL